MKGLVLAVVLLGVALVAADRTSVLLAERAVANQVSTTGVTSADVEIRGVPFLTQAVRGRYDEVFVTATDVPAGETRLARLDATLQGVHVPLADAVSGDVSAVPVEGVRGTVLVSYSELGRRAEAAELEVEPVGDRLEITGTVDVLEQSFSAATESTVQLVQGEIVVTAESFDVGSGVANAVLTRALRGVFDFRISLEELPYGLVPSGLRVTDRGIELDAFASDTVLTRPQ
jgi:hypothetical protein